MPPAIHTQASQGAPASAPGALRALSAAGSSKARWQAKQDASATAGNSTPQWRHLRLITLHDVLLPDVKASQTPGSFKTISPQIPTGILRVHFSFSPMALAFALVRNSS